MGTTLGTSGTSIKSVKKALMVLEVFARQQRDLGYMEVNRELAFPKSVTYKLLTTLTAAGFLRKDPLSRRYNIGPAVLTLADAFLNSGPLTRDSADILRRLSLNVGHTASLGILDGATVLYVATVEGREAVKATAQIGDRRPLHATATGKILLSDLPDAEVDRLLGEGSLPRFTAQTITDVATLKKELEEVRRTGIAYNRRQHTDKVSAVAAAVYDHRGRVAAGISVGLPASDLDAVILEELVPVVAEHAAELSRRLGAAAAAIRHRPTVVPLQQP
jgi:IclR family acetate operon transcriptional repressor